jgi:hypothetical protein
VINKILTQLDGKVAFAADTLLPLPDPAAGGLVSDQPPRPDPRHLR